MSDADLFLQSLAERDQDVVRLEAANEALRQQYAELARAAISATWWIDSQSPDARRVIRDLGEVLKKHKESEA